MKSPVGNDAPDASEDSIASVFEKADVGGTTWERVLSAHSGHRVVSALLLYFGSSGD